MTALYHEDGVLVIKNIAHLSESLQMFLNMVPSSGKHNEYQTRIAEMAAAYEISPLLQWAAEYDGSNEPMSSDLETLYLEAEREIYESHLSPLCEG